MSFDNDGDVGWSGDEGFNLKRAPQLRNLGYLTSPTLPYLTFTFLCAKLYFEINLCINIFSKFYFRLRNT